MTRVDFYANVQDRLETACRITVKAHRQGHCVTIFCPDADAAARLDRLLWMHPPTGFVPHCPAEHPLAALTPVILDRTCTAPLQHEVLVNLSDERPQCFARFERLIEIVSTDEEDRSRARERFRFYRDRGYALETHDLG